MVELRPICLDNSLTERTDDHNPSSNEKDGVFGFLKRIKSNNGHTIAP